MDREARVAMRAQAHIDAGAFSGIEWRVLRGGVTWLEGRAGQADALSNRAMAQKPIYRIYSMTKPIVSAVAVMLIEEGRLRLMDPVAKFLPDFARMQVVESDGSLRPARSAMLIEHLLTHKSGLSYGFLRDCPAAEHYRQATVISSDENLERLVGAIAGHPLAFDPGTQWRYSMSTDVMARVIEVIEGEPLGQILARRIFGPLGLEDTAFFVPEAKRERIMTMFGQGNLDRIMDYPSGPQQLVHAEGDLAAPADKPDFARGGHGLFSTLDDYTRVARFLASGRASDGEVLLSRKGTEALWTNRVDPGLFPLRIGPIALPGYGFGLGGRVMLEPGRLMGLSSRGECGWAGAASTYFWIDKREDLIGIVLSQYLGSIVPLADDMRDAVYQALN